MYLFLIWLLQMCGCVGALNTKYYFKQHGLLICNVHILMTEGGQQAQSEFSII